MEPANKCCKTDSTTEDFGASDVLFPVVFVAILMFVIWISTIDLGTCTQECTEDHEPKTRSQK